MARVYSAAKRDATTLDPIIMCRAWKPPLGGLLLLGNEVHSYCCPSTADAYCLSKLNNIVRSSRSALLAIPLYPERG